MGGRLAPEGTDSVSATGSTNDTFVNVTPLNSSSTWVLPPTWPACGCSDSDDCTTTTSTIASSARGGVVVVRVEKLAGRVTGRADTVVAPRSLYAQRYTVAVKREEDSTSGADPGSRLLAALAMIV